MEVTVKETSREPLGNNRKLRHVRLVRRGTSPLGFAIRGGKEHGTGVFVSHVEHNSQAQMQGLKVGDQVLRVNGFPVEGAVHNEVLSLLRAKSHLNLKVRTVGLIPVKDNKRDPLTWRLIEETSPTEVLPPVERLMSNDGSSSRSTWQTSSPSGDWIETRVFLNLAGQNSLGCCICKGPAEKPGIYVQSTKNGGLAREAGLRPGDQVVECNGQSFLDIDFTDAVYHLKSSKQLQLVVWKAAGIDLFPGESSGYNSSASSVTGDSGDQSPTSDNKSKRLSIVKEELTELEERHQHLNCVSIDRRKDWDEIEYEWKKAERLEVERRKEEKPSDKSEGVYLKHHSSVEVLVNGACVEQQQQDHQPKFQFGDTTGRKRSKNNNEGTAENIGGQECVYVEPKIIIEVKGQDSGMVNGGRGQQEWRYAEPDPLQEERRKLQEEQLKLQEELEKLAQEKKRFEEERKRTLSKTPSLSSSTSIGSGSSLASAISLEIQKRMERSDKDTNPKGEVKEEERKNDILKSVDHAKRQTHALLIEEFKRAHQRMFPEQPSGSSGPEPVFQLPQPEPVPKMEEERERCPASPSRKQPQPQASETQPSRTQQQPATNGQQASSSTDPQSQELRGRLQVKPGLNAAPPPPPPPPPPASQPKVNGVRPTSPSPDYTPRQSPASKMRVYLNPPPVPPKKSNKPADPPKKSGSVVLSIGAYPNSNFRPSPNRFEFLQQPSTSPKQVKKSDVNGLSRDLQSELAQTLSRSNLRQKAVSVDSLIRAEEDDTKATQNGGEVTQNGGGQDGNGDEASQPSVRSLSAKYSALLSHVGRPPTSGRVTTVVVRDSSVPITSQRNGGGILKNSSNSVHHARLKNITFGEM